MNLKRFGLTLFAVCLLFSAQNAAAQGENETRIRAPELIGGRTWLNTAKPLTIAGLKGKVVLLDFWTYGCINCIHIIPDLKNLEDKYGNNLVVIGVHSAKFENEKESENIRRIVLRYELEHPIVNDADFKIWNEYGVRAYPTQVVIDPEGYLVRTTIGEGQLGLLDQTIGETIEKFRGKLNETPLKFALEKEKFAASPLLFPGKVLADAKTDRLFISDSNHHRIVVTKLDGTLLETIGNGEKGFADGDFQTATFFRPQGLALDGKFLYVADTENHLIRRVDLTAKKVETIAGTGKQVFTETGGAAREIGLNSPWDLQLVEKQLFIAMAGEHQIWRMDLAANTIAPFAGTQSEAREDGALNEAAFAQPSGLAFDGTNLYVADSESNIIRGINLRQKTVKTLAGGDLYEFGDKDGRGDNARLQHPLGVAMFGKSVLIADTYNHKIKILNPATGVVGTFLGSGKPTGIDSPKAGFYEPGGLSAANGKLYIADTNNHAVRVANLQTKQITTLKIANLQPPPNGKSARLK